MTSSSASVTSGSADPAFDRAGLVRVLAALGLFGVAFGLVEAAVVADLRAIYDPIHRRHYPDSPAGELFPILTLDGLRSEGPTPRRLLAIELAREAATLVMLAAVALAAARRARTWLAAFAVAFGVWDLAFYASLRVMLDWPDSLWTWDLLFLLPLPWSGPVLAPVLVSLAMIGAGVLTLARESSGRPVVVRAGTAAMIGIGALIVVVAFCWDWRRVMSGCMPSPFRWDIFGAGMAIGLTGFARSPRSTVRPCNERVGEGSRADGRAAEAGFAQ